MQEGLSAHAYVPWLSLGFKHILNVFVNRVGFFMRKSLQWTLFYDNVFEATAL